MSALIAKKNPLVHKGLNRGYLLFEVNTKYITSSVLKHE